MASRSVIVTSSYWVGGIMTAGWWRISAGGSVPVHYDVSVIPGWLVLLTELALLQLDNPGLHSGQVTSD